MRLIDADKLKENISEKLVRRFNRWDKTITVSEWETFTRDIIDYAPTVERPQGEWIFIGKSTNCIMCSNCTFMFHTATPFCPYCGTNMRGMKND